MSRGRKHRRGGPKRITLSLSQLVDFDWPVDLVVVVRDLETDDVLWEAAVGRLENKPVLVSLRCEGKAPP